MGNDGGSIPKRRELVKEAARNPTASELKETLQEHQAHLWNIDPLSQRPLSKPIVSDSLGRLFNKDSVIEFLLPSNDKSPAKHAEQEALLRGTVKSLKDVVEVKFEVDEAATEMAKGKSGPGEKTEVWICPVTREELGPQNRAVYLVPCGHAFSASAVKEVSGEQCLQCNEAYASNDLIPILPTLETDIARLTLRMGTLKEKGLAHSLKKASGGTKKRKKTDANIATDVDSFASEVVDIASPAPVSVRLSMLKEDANVSSPRQASSKSSTPQPLSRTSTPKPLNVNINNAATASLTAKVLEEQEARNKRRKMDANRNLNTLYSSHAGIDKKHKDIDFMNRGFSMPKR